MRPRSATLGLALLVLTTAAFVHWIAPASDAGSQSSAPPSPVRPAAPGAQGRPFFDGAHLPQPPAAQAGTAPPPVRWRELHAKFERATSLRAFYYEAVRKPEEGGYLYASKAIEACRMPPAIDGPIQARRQQAIDRLRERCGFSEQEREDAQRHFNAIRDFKFSDDPLYRDIFGYLMAQTDAERMKVLQTAIDGGNPDVISSLVQPAIAAQLLASLPKGAQTPAYLDYVQVLLACRLGANCGPDATLTLQLCVWKGWCGNSLPEALRDQFGADFIRLEQLSKQALGDIRKRELARLAHAP
jgi:hypothetical protein